jgi:GNAT superfamily N-acetyltransferase
MALTCRPIHPDDKDFLYAVYAGTRAEELAPLDWNEEQKTAFLKMQFSAQHQYYQEQFPDAAFKVVLLDGKPIGRLYVERRENEIRVIDIALLPEYRNGGIGTSLLKELIAEADEAHKPVRIHIERFNRALRLYERLGFTKLEDRGVYFLLAWSPTHQPNTAS